MKKILAVLLTVLMMVSFACAESAVTEKTEFYYDDTLTLKAACPEGYTLSYEVNGGVMFIYMSATEYPEAHARYITAIVPTDNEEYAAVSRLNDLTEEQLNGYIDSCTEGWADPTVSVLETGEGSKAILLNENAEGVDFAQLYAVYHGFQITTYVDHEDLSGVTDEDIELLMWFHTNMDFVNN